MEEASLCRPPEGWPTAVCRLEADPLLCGRKSAVGVRLGAQQTLPAVASVGVASRARFGSRGKKVFLVLFSA